MSRMIQARVTDPQYDWLFERAIDEEGDMSAAIRGAIDLARSFADLLSCPDPHGRLQARLDAAQEEMAREAYFDEYGHFPEDAPK
jgi:hypothetical protein